MKISTSELSMDASTGHMDVTKLGLSSNFTANVSEKFALKFGNRQQSNSAQFEHSQVASLTSKSTVTSSGLTENYVSSQEQMLEYVIGEFTGREASVSPTGSMGEKDAISWQRPSKAA